MLLHLARVVFCDRVVIHFRHKMIEDTPTTFLRVDIKSSSCLRFVNGIYI